MQRTKKQRKRTTKKQRKRTTKHSAAEQALAVLGGSESHPYRIGQSYFVRTLTYHYTGRIVRVTDKELVLSESAWIPESGRWAECLRTGVVEKCEPTPDDVLAIVPRDGSASYEWKHPLPRSVR